MAGVQIGQVLAFKDLPTPLIELVVKKEQKYVDILIIDSGTGIPIEIQQKIMEPFFTTKELNQGTGLDLSISKSILRDHQGELSLMSDQSNTTFRMRLPAIDE